MCANSWKSYHVNETRNKVFISRHGIYSMHIPCGNSWIVLPEGVEPEVRVLGLSILSNGRPDIIIPLPLPPKSKSHLFTLKEGSAYNIKFTFTVRRNIVSGLTYIHTVWKNGFRGSAISYEKTNYYSCLCFIFGLFGNIIFAMIRLFGDVL